MKWGSTFLAKLWHFDHLHGVELAVRCSLDFVHLGVCSHSEFADDSELFLDHEKSRRDTDISTQNYTLEL